MPKTTKSSGAQRQYRRGPAPYSPEQKRSANRYSVGFSDPEHAAVAKVKPPGIQMGVWLRSLALKAAGWQDSRRD